jgi:hypothetical protein
VTCSQLYFCNFNSMMHVCDVSVTWLAVDLAVWQVSVMVEFRGCFCNSIAGCTFVTCSKLYFCNLFNSRMHYTCDLFTVVFL